MGFSFLFIMTVGFLVYVNHLHLELSNKDRQIKSLRIERDSIALLYEEAKSLFEFRQGVWAGKDFVSKKRDFDRAIQERLD